MNGCNHSLATGWTYLSDGFFWSVLVGMMSTCSINEICNFQRCQSDGKYNRWLRFLLWCKHTKPCRVSQSVPFRLKLIPPHNQNRISVVTSFSVSTKPTHQNKITTQIFFLLVVVLKQSRLNTSSKEKPYSNNCIGCKITSLSEIV